MSRRFELSVRPKWYVSRRSFEYSSAHTSCVGAKIYLKINKLKDEKLAATLMSLARSSVGSPERTLGTEFLPRLGLGLSQTTMEPLRRLQDLHT